MDEPLLDGQAPAEQTPGAAPGSNSVNVAVAGWQRQLLQLNRRNNLLYFRKNLKQADTQSRCRTIIRCVPIVNFGPDEIDEALQQARSGLSFDYTPQRPFGGFDEAGDDIEVVPGDLETDVDPQALQRTLLRFFRKEREWLEEQGINVLFLAVGFLKWLDEDSERATSPLLLLPCDLKRSSPRDPFVLHREDDDTSANATLRHKLDELGVELPEFEHDLYSEYLADVSRRVVTGRTGWGVTQEVILATFQYTKLAMWEDLQGMRDAGVSHPLIRRLAGETMPEVWGGVTDGAALRPKSDLAGGRLDDIPEIRQTAAVLPADHSQLRAVAAAGSGNHLVIHGPPGTGKSQTIVNIIANLMRQGKRVLFVSEKSVALDVVKERLEQEELGVFCLDMHSERATKSSVYGQLRKSIEDGRVRHDGGLKQKELEASRAKLNDVVRSLHETRHPLERSIYQVHGEYAHLRDLPTIEFPVPDAASLDEARLTAITSLATSIARQPEGFRDLPTTKWAALKLSASSISIAEQVRRDADEALGIVRRTMQGLDEQSNRLGVLPPADLGTAGRLHTLALHLCKRPVVRPHWLERRALPEFRRVAREQREQQAEARRLAARMEQAFGGNIPDADYQRLSRTARPRQSDIDALQAALGPDWAPRLVPKPDALLKMVAQVSATATALVEALGKLSRQLEFEVPASSWPEALRGLDMTRELLSLDVIPEAWMDIDHLANVKLLADAARRAQAALDGAETDFFAYYDRELVDAIDDGMLVRYRTDHQSGMRRLLQGAYRSDRRLLRGYARVPGKLSPAGGLDVVQRAMDIREMRRDWTSAYAGVEPMLGRYASERETDWPRVERQLDVTARLLRDWPGNPARLQTLLTSQETRQTLRSASDRATTAIQALKTALHALQSDRLDLDQASPAAVMTAVGQAQRPLETLVEHSQAVARRLVEPPDDWWGFCHLIDAAALLQTIERREDDKRVALQRDFGVFFKGRDSEWDDVLVALAWCSDLLDLVTGRPGERLREVVCAPKLPFDPGVLATEIESLRSSYPPDLQMLDVRFDAVASAWGAWSSASFDALAEWLQFIRKDADNAASWIEFKQACNDLDQSLGPGTVQRIRSVTDDSRQVPGIVRKRLFSTWLDAICPQDVRLRDFSARNHEERRHEFRRLDTDYFRVMREQVRQALFTEYPGNQTSVTDAGQLGVLNGELSKRRRQMSVRQLLVRAPQVIQALKPCFLMSPLAVSQYLARTNAVSANIRFDTVIFDEASQVLPEDAVPAISRAEQAIVVGDRKQLPPTTLFQHRYEHEGEDENSDDDTDWFEGRESILDVLVGMAGSGVTEHYLGVHYRSRHESLIRYSNHYFYEDRLLTFPSPGRTAAVGVAGVYLPDGRYDAGGSRTNRMEAEKVVQLIFNLMRTRPAESVGVVTLSRAQADLVERLIDEVRLNQPEFDQHFAPEREEQCFVKNLENVQGDERDHIVLSVGYGPSTESGQVYNRFGPINNEGGERRLNVAVSRARKSMTVVHSLKPEDISSESRGARLLKRYLEFARSPDTAIEQNVTVNAQAETENSFEEAVRRALVERGHQVDVQVGVSGYRIDLAIRADNGQGHALGIECDGATYHSAPAARDRDWLRQSILEGLGWKIHRVWSRSWIQNPERELEAIERALQKTNAEPADDQPEVGGREPTEAVDTGAEFDSLADGAGPTVTQQRQSKTVPDHAVDGPFDRYETADLSRIRLRARSVGGESLEELCELVTEVVRVEGPVHTNVVIERIRRRFGGGRVRGRTRDRLHNAMRDAVSRNDLAWVPESVGNTLFEERFLVLVRQSGSVRPRTPWDEESRRRIEHIPLAELEAGVLACVKLLYGAGRNDLIAETARRFGFQRTGKYIASRIGEAVDQLHSDGRLTGDAQMLSPAS